LFNLQVVGSGRLLPVVYWYGRTNGMDSEPRTVLSDLEYEPRLNLSVGQVSI
jgi:hypothetical protein